MIAAPKWWRIVLFKNGRRIEKRLPASQRDAAVAKVRQLREKGVRAHLVPSNVIRNRMWPSGDIKEHRDAGELWCPYCGAWRWFKIPRAYPNAEFMSVEWYLNSFRNQEIRVCAWCCITMLDFYVCKANGTWAEVKGGHRRFTGKGGRVRRRIS